VSNEQQKQLDRIEAKVDLLLKKYGASQSLNDDLQRVDGGSPACKRQSKAVKMADYKAMYRKKGIV